MRNEVKRARECVRACPAVQCQLLVWLILLRISFVRLLRKLAFLSPSAGHDTFCFLGYIAWMFLRKSIAKTHVCPTADINRDLFLISASKVGRNALSEETGVRKIHWKASRDFLGFAFSGTRRKSS